MLRKVTLIMLVLALGLIFVVPVSANPGKPNFGAGLYADGRQWGTKVTTNLPPPKGNNRHSFDGFYFITDNDWDGTGKGWLQAPVMESGPGNPKYNGGRWVTFRVTWADDAPVTLLTSFADIEDHADAGHLTIGTQPEPDGAHESLYFQCPLLPYKP
jgi:hypothetical protein